jgi:hypothetical protein
VWQYHVIGEYFITLFNTVIKMWLIHSTYSQDDPEVQLCILMVKNTKNLSTFWKLVKV